MKKNLLSLFAITLALVAALAPIPVYAATTGNIHVQVEVIESATTDLGAAKFNLNQVINRVFANGTSTNQASKIYVDTASLAGSAAQSYDLDGTLTGQLGTVTFTRIYAIFVWRETAYAASTQDENLTVGGDFYLTKVLSGWVDDAILGKCTPYGMWSFISPDSTGTAVTATTGDVLTITNASSADTAPFNIIVIGS